ncbi:T9SS type A sorting domain-containing protein [Persicobacter sp. CCB-QB2]|uniref:T9SS type A sorting domain-containing protein n=1 Tax=Persicobacter sp. CCB-QB2 TaxID=1561025 RepID=UPI0012FC37CC|nr:T9SS type A sorting domain-containing protein [Persicobacter sp. CCB-QB2]
MGVGDAAFAMEVFLSEPEEVHWYRLEFMMEDPTQDDQLTLSSQQVSPDSTFSMPLTGPSGEFFGFQAGFQFDPNALTLESITAGDIPLSENHYAVANGEIRISWDSGSPVQVGDHWLTLNFRLNQLAAGDSSRVVPLVSFPAEIIDADYQLMEPEVLGGYVKVLEMVQANLFFEKAESGTPVPHFPFIWNGASQLADASGGWTYSNTKGSPFQWSVMELPNEAYGTDVSTLDILLARRSLLTGDPLSTAGAWAADINGDGNLSTQDLVLMRAHILQSTAPLPIIAQFEGLQQEEGVLNQDVEWRFQAVQLGDVSGDWLQSANREAEPPLLQFTMKKVANGWGLFGDFGDQEISALQWQLNGNQHQLGLTSADISPWYLNEQETALNMVYLPQHPLALDPQVPLLVMEHVKAGQDLLGAGLLPRLWDQDFNEYGVELVWEYGQVAKEVLAFPNPASDQLLLNTGGRAVVYHIMNQQGQLVAQGKLGNEGASVFPLQWSNSWGTGVFMLRLLKNGKWEQQKVMIR